MRVEDIVLFVLIMIVTVAVRRIGRMLKRYFKCTICDKPFRKNEGQFSKCEECRKKIRRAMQGIRVRVDKEEE